MMTKKVIACLILIYSILISGCSDNKEFNNLIKLSVEQCDGTISTEVVIGKWYQSFTLRCSSFNMK